MAPRFYRQKGLPRMRGPAFVNKTGFRGRAGLSEACWVRSRQLQFCEDFLKSNGGRSGTQSCDRPIDGVHARPPAIADPLRQFLQCSVEPSPKAVFAVDGARSLETLCRRVPRFAAHDSVMNRFMSIVSPTNNGRDPSVASGLGILDNERTPSRAVISWPPMSGRVIART